MVDAVTVTLLTGPDAGKRLTGWQEVEITRGLDRAAAGFTLGVARTSRQRAAGQAQVPLRPGIGVRVSIGPDRVITGWVDEVSPSRRANDHSVRVSGRARPCDMVDCSAVNSPGQWRGSTLGAIAAALAAPFGVGVSIAATVAQVLVGTFEVEQGETAFEAVERLARLHGYLVHDDVDGRLVIGRPERGRSRAALLHVDGPDGGPHRDNTVLESSGRFSMVGRHSEIIVKGQSGAMDVPAIEAASVSATARDANVGRFRPLIITAESEATPALAQKRADWEVSRRAGKAFTATMVVPGWRQSPGGVLWDVGLVVPVRDSALDLQRDMLIAGLIWTLSSDGGRRTTLTLEPPEAWEPQPLVPEGVASSIPYGGLRTQFAGTDP